MAALMYGSQAAAVPVDREVRQRSRSPGRVVERVVPQGVIARTRSASGPRVNPAASSSPPNSRASTADRTSSEQAGQRPPADLVEAPAEPVDDLPDGGPGRRPRRPARPGRRRPPAAAGRRTAGRPSCRSRSARPPGRRRRRRRRTGRRSGRSCFGSWSARVTASDPRPGPSPMARVAGPAPHGSGYSGSQSCSGSASHGVSTSAPASVTATTSQCRSPWTPSK